MVDSTLETRRMPLRGYLILTLAVNLPGPVAAARLTSQGAEVVKVEPPEGDPLRHFDPDYYGELRAGQEVLTLDLKVPDGRESLHDRLANTDLLLTSSRPGALSRLGLSWPELRDSYPSLSQVAIVGQPAPHEDEPGHDLTYQAREGLLTPPQMPRTLVADLAGAEIAAREAISLLLARERGMGAGYSQVALSEAAKSFAEPFRRGQTASGGMLGGAFPGYALYRAREGYVALAALEPHFWKRLLDSLEIEDGDGRSLEKIFTTQDAGYWEEWANEHDLPLVAVRNETSQE